MILWQGESLSKAFGSRDLFTDLSLSIFEGNRIGLIGRNGCGKSTLLKIIKGLEKADKGTISPKRGIKIGYLPQSCHFPAKMPLDILVETLHGSDLYEGEKERLAEMWLSKLGFTGSEPSADRLSGGWKKRLLLAQEMMLAPDLILLDEPTNHLDLEGVLWLEKFLTREATTYLLVSHDRYFLQHTTNRIIEIDPVYPRGLFSLEGSYTNFLSKKEEFLKGQLEQERSMASKARREVEWLRSNPKARTTKSQARIDEAHELLDDLSEIKKRNQERNVSIDFAGSERSTRQLLVAKNVRKEVGGRLLFEKLDFTLSPGSRMGLMGPNGSGKTTLLRLLASEITPDLGTLKTADDLKVVYFDQHRNKLPDHITLREALSPNKEFVTFRGQPIHINGWCKRFLFSPDFLDLPLSRLSGGERARIAIAHLMLQPADLLLLDEPTNDLDIPTLEMLEENLLDFPGALVLITHDRYMLDRICNIFLALGDPSQSSLFASYAQWEASIKPSIAPSPKPEKEDKREAAPKKKGLSYAEQKEYKQIEGKILKLEEEVKELSLLLQQKEVAENSARLAEVCTAIGLAETKIEKLYLLWEELDQKQNS
jgi:ATP-binding cassette subfamily F protein uup